MNWWIVVGVVFIVLITGKIIANKYPKVTWEEMVNYEKPKKRVKKVVEEPQEIYGASGSAGSVGPIGAIGPISPMARADYGITESLRQAEFVKRQLDQYENQKNQLLNELQNQRQAYQQLARSPYYKFSVGQAVTHVPTGTKTFIVAREGEMEDRIRGTFAYKPHYDLGNGMITIPEGDLI